MITNDRDGRKQIAEIVQNLHNSMQYAKRIRIEYCDCDIIRVYCDETSEMVSEFSVAEDSNRACLRDIIRHSEEWG